MDIKEAKPIGTRCVRCYGQANVLIEGWTPDGPEEKRSWTCPRCHEANAIMVPGKVVGVAILTGRIVGQGAPADPLPAIERKRLYTRTEIRGLIGGGGVMDYLPSRKNEILAGCFRTDYNPEAPRVVLVGNGPRIERAAELLLEQGTPVPVFLKRNFNEWQYVGYWRGVRLAKDHETIAAHSPNIARVSGVLFMEPSEASDT